MSGLSSFPDLSSWVPEHEGQLSVDVLENERFVFIRSTVAGTRAEDLDVAVTHDTVTIRGHRHHACAEWEDATFHVQECHWGAFSRSIVLPSHVRPAEADAVLKNGILTITLPKTEVAASLSVIELP